MNTEANIIMKKLKHFIIITIFLIRINDIIIIKRIYIYTLNVTNFAVTITKKIYIYIYIVVTNTILNIL